MRQNLPPIEDVLSHRGCMLLLAAVNAHDEESVLCTALAEPMAWYANVEGAMPAWLGIELMAQAIAAHVALLARTQGKSPRPGALLGTRAYRSHCAHFPAGVPIRITARQSFRDDAGLAAYHCTLNTADGEPLAEAALTVYEPADFEQFIRGGGGQ